MRTFTLQRATDAHDAVGKGTPGAASRAMAEAASPSVLAPVQYLAGGTNVLDLMKLDVMRPACLVDINDLSAMHGAISLDERGLHLGALTRMAEAARHPVVVDNYPAIAESLTQAASAQLRNMASLGGNLLQRTRCNYFRDTSWTACNKRNPGSGCAARDGVNRRNAILGASESCIASYPGDFAIALIALDATLTVQTPDGTARQMPLAALHRGPGDAPHIETTLAAGELITAITVPPGPWTRRSHYLKIRDRASYDFALASAAVALHLGADRTVIDARIGLGGLVARPWRAHDAEAALRGRVLDEAAATEAARIAFASADAFGEMDFKPDLGRRTLVRALLETAALPVA